MCEALICLSYNIYISFGTKLYRQIVGIQMGTICAPLVADLFLVCYLRDFMLSFSGDKDAEVIGAFNSTSRYLDDLLNRDYYMVTFISSHLTSRGKRNQPEAEGRGLIPLFEG